MATAMNPRIDSMERGLSEPRSSPFVSRENYPTYHPNVEEGRGFYSMNRASSPYSSPGNSVSLEQNTNPNPSIWDKFRKTIGLGGKRRLRTLKRKKSRKSRKSRNLKKVKKVKKSRKSRKTYKKSYKRGGTTKKVWLDQGKTPNGQYGGSTIVNPYSPPMDFAPVNGVPTAQPHNWVG